MTEHVERNALTVDVEDYFHVTGFARSVRPSDWPRHESRVVGNTRRLLSLLADFDVRGTFFVLGWVAERFPQLVREIRSAGHDVGCHSYWHRLVYEQTPEEFRADLRRGRGVLEDILGEAVTAYRAPSFSITRASLWALMVLAEEGIALDSSIFPIRHDRYGIPGADTAPHWIDTPAGALREFPASALRLCGVRLPVSGGGYFRLYPYWFTAHCLRRIARTERRPFVFYVHPWEVDPDQPRLPASWGSRFRHYHNLAATEGRLRRLLSEFAFAPIAEVSAAYDGRAMRHVLREPARTTLYESGPPRRTSGDAPVASSLAAYRSRTT